MYVELHVQVAPLNFVQLFVKLRQCVLKLKVYWKYTIEIIDARETLRQRLFHKYEISFSYTERKY